MNDPAVALLPFDHLLAVVLGLAVPIRGWLTIRRVLARVERGDPDARLRAYWRALSAQWTLTVVILIWWAHCQRPITALGVRSSTPIGITVGSFLVVAFLWLLGMQPRIIAGLPPERLARLRDRLGPTAAILPSNAQEQRWFSAAAVTAGICEEVLYRGFLLWYFQQLMPLWAAIIISALMFGVAHIYQGRRAILKTGLVGLAMTAVYLVTGALWTSMIIHAAVDLSGGVIGRRLASRLSL